MKIIRFPDVATERRGLGFLVTRFPGRTWDTGETLVPEEALAALTAAGISFRVEGTATHEQLAAFTASIRNPAASAVQ